LLARVEKNTVINLRSFGHEFGIAFQVVDDVLDLIGDEERLGKPAGTDLEQGIITLPVICYLERGNDDRIINKILSGKRTQKDVKTAIDMIRKSGAIEDALNEARAHARKSKAAIVQFPSGKCRQLLYDLVDYVVDRQH
jgi:geranylgeranyl pyrophosphate synthase